MTVDEALLEADAALRRSASPDVSAHRVARVLLATMLGRTPAWLLAHGDAELDLAQRARYRRMYQRRSHGEPLAYIVGEVGFYGRTFAVTPDVLVPRPETEGLIDVALEAFPDRDGALRLCDVGTGSGIIAVTLAAERPRAEVVATDVSAAALAVAKRNAATCGVAERIRFHLEDGLGPAAAAAGPFDAIIANLPYVRTADLAPAPDATSFEPPLARDGGGDGLSVYRRVLAGMVDALACNGVIVLEAGAGTACELQALVEAAFGGRAAASVLADAGGVPRIVILRAP